MEKHFPHIWFILGVCLAMSFGPGVLYFPPLLKLIPWIITFMVILGAWQMNINWFKKTSTESSLWITTTLYIMRALIIVALMATIGTALMQMGVAYWLVMALVVIGYSWTYFRKKPGPGVT